jgi:hypothetical protein
MMGSPMALLTWEGLETLMGDVADRLSHHPDVDATLALNHVSATPDAIRDAVLAAAVQLDPSGGITIRPTRSGQRILIPIAKFVADAIDATLGERVMFTMET